MGNKNMRHTKDGCAFPTCTEKPKPGKTWCHTHMTAKKLQQEIRAEKLTPGDMIPGYVRLADLPYRRDPWDQSLTYDLDGDN